MPKIKTRRAAAKRFKLTGSGKLKRRRAFASHILTKKNRKRKRRLRAAALAHDSNERSLNKQMPYL